MIENKVYLSHVEFDAGKDDVKKENVQKGRPSHGAYRLSVIFPPSSTVY
jgi:hypothetical protein